MNDYTDGYKDGREIGWRNGWSAALLWAGIDINDEKRQELERYLNER